LERKRETAKRGAEGEIAGHLKVSNRQGHLNREERKRSISPFFESRGKALRGKGGTQWEEARFGLIDRAETGGKSKKGHERSPKRGKWGKSRLFPVRRARRKKKSRWRNDVKDFSERKEDGEGVPER